MHWHRPDVEWKRTRRLFLVIGCLVVAWAGPGAVSPSWARDVECVHCDARVPESALFCTSCGNSTAAGQGVFCWRCGLKLAPLTQYCSRCGSQACTSMRTQSAATLEVATTTQVDPVPRDAPSDTVALPEVPLSSSATGADDAPQPPANESEARSSSPWSLHAGESPPDASSQRAAESGATQTPDKDDEPFGALIDYPVSLRGEDVLLPPRLFDSPTGDILPSLAIHAGGGLGFGFSDEHSRTERWVVSFGLGGAGEAVIASSNIVHIAAPESQPLLGFRLGLPVGWAGDAVAERTGWAFNVAATGDNTFSTGEPFVSLDDAWVDHLSYKHRETTVGVAGTVHMDRTRLHAIVHWTDLRFEDVMFATGGNDLQAGRDEKDVHTSFGVGLDYAANPKTYFLAELRTAPQVNFVAADGKIEVASQIEYTMGLRFFLDQTVALDANVNIDDEALGLADMQIGFGIHVILEPHRVH